MLEANPTLTPEQIKQIIIDTAREDSHTGDIPDNGSVEWGHGKINALACLQSVLGVSGLADYQQSLPWRIYPNPTTDFIQIINLTEDIVNIQIIDATGKLCSTSLDQNRIDLRGLSTGLYFVRLIREARVEQAQFVIE